MVSLSSTSGVLRLSVVVTLATVALLLTSPALSQVHQERDQDVIDRPSDESVSPSLPGWARPAEPSVSDPQSSRSPAREGSSVDESMRTNAPPPGGEPIPVDGGLALLAAAGAGYAVRKLNEDEEDDEDPA